MCHINRNSELSNGSKQNTPTGMPCFAGAKQGNGLADWPGLKKQATDFHPLTPHRKMKKTFKKEFDLQNYGSVLSAGGVDIFADHQDFS